MAKSDRYEPGEPDVYTVSRLTREIKDALEGRFHSVWVEGEISNFRRYPSGHWYFTLKDADAVLSAVMFRRATVGVGFSPADGAGVRAFGAVSVYAPHGKYQLICERLEEQGLGALQKAFEELKRRLAAEGLFDEARKKPLPDVPSKVGIVTSPKGAAIRDILNVLGRRFPGLPVLIAPARVQGAEAPGEIVAGIRALDARDDVDVLIVGRGGGSLEDLWAFNTEEVARAIHAARKPVISAVGHEIDFTISDMVADLRAPTPSAAAELVCRSREQLVQLVGVASGRLRRAILGRMERARHALERSAREVGDPRGRIAQLRLRVDDLGLRLAPRLRGALRERRARFLGVRARLAAVDLEARVAERRRRLAEVLRRMRALIATRVGYGRKDLAELAGRLRSLDPYAVLERGYSITYDAAGAVVRDASLLLPGAPLQVRLHRGSVGARVTDVAPEPESPEFPESPKSKEDSR